MVRKWSVIGITLLMLVANAVIYRDFWLSAYRTIDLRLTPAVFGMVIEAFAFNALPIKNTRFFRFRVTDIWERKEASGDPASSEPKRGFRLPPVKVALPGIDTRFVNIAMFVALMTNLPILATIEEIIFRLGTTGWPDAVYRSILFGLIHMTMGCTTTVGIVAAAMGMVLSYAYFQGGVPLTSQIHFQYDAFIIGYAVILSIFSSLRPAGQK